MNDAFNKTHPLVGLLYFALVIGFSMFLMHPVCLIISVLCAFLNAVYTNGSKSALFTAKYVIPLIIVVMIINPVFNHRGMTILAYLPWKNPLTLESIIFGGASAVMFGSVMLWFSLFNTVMTSDKIIYLFGRIIPSLSLVISMTLRFVPRFNAQLKEVKTAQNVFENSNGRQSFRKKFKSLINIFSVMISWSLENAIETADSMKSRGYGLKGRTAFSNFTFKKSDGILLAVILSSGAVLITLLCLGTAKYSYFPLFRFDYSGILSIAFFVIYFFVMLIPFIINVWEGLKWKRLRSAI